MSTGKKIRAMLATLIGTGMIAFSAHAKNSLFIVINDHLGTPQMLIDEHKNIVWHAEYDEFGKADILVEKTEFNLRFPGQYYDKETGLHYNYYRDYDPALGRYSESDPIGLAGGINTYAYVANNPVMYVDPLGLQAPIDVLSIVSKVMDASGLAGQATTEAQSKFPDNGDLWNGKGDAFRHCYASCLVSSNHNKEFAVLLGWVNEKKGNIKNNQNPTEEAMDNHNNSCGFDYGDSAKNDNDCMQMCLSGLENGELTFSEVGGPFPGDGYKESRGYEK